MNVLVILATFVAAGVEWVEALTIVLAVGIFKSWRTAALATLAAVGVLAVLVVAFGVSLRTYVPENVAQSAVGVFLLLSQQFFVDDVFFENANAFEFRQYFVHVSGPIGRLLFQ